MDFIGAPNCVYPHVRHFYPSCVRFPLDYMTFGAHHDENRENVWVSCALRQRPPTASASRLPHPAAMLTSPHLISDLSSAIPIILSFYTPLPTSAAATETKLALPAPDPA